MQQEPDDLAQVHVFSLVDTNTATAHNPRSELNFLKPRKEEVVWDLPVEKHQQTHCDPRINQGMFRPARHLQRRPRSHVR